MRNSRKIKFISVILLLGLALAGVIYSEYCGKVAVVKENNDAIDNHTLIEIEKMDDGLALINENQYRKKLFIAANNIKNYYYDFQIEFNHGELTIECKSKENKERNIQIYEIKHVPNDVNTIKLIINGKESAFVCRVYS